MITRASPGRQSFRRLAAGRRAALPPLLRAATAFRVRLVLLVDIAEAAARFEVLPVLRVEVRALVVFVFGDFALADKPDGFADFTFLDAVEVARAPARGAVSALLVSLSSDLSEA